MTDNTESNESAAAETQENTQNEPQEMTTEAGVEGEKGSWYSKPENLGNSAGETVQSTLEPVGKYAGKGFETIGRPVGGLVEPLVGGVMKGGKAFGEQAGVGYGNAEGGPAKAAEAEGERMKAPVGGMEQTADNPLGLSGE